MKTYEILELIKANIVDCNTCDGTGLDCNEPCYCYNGKRIDVSCLLGIIDEDELDKQIEEVKNIEWVDTANNLEGRTQ